MFMAMESMLRGMLTWAKPFQKRVMILYRLTRKVLVTVKVREVSFSKRRLVLMIC